MPQATPTRRGCWWLERQNAIDGEDSASDAGFGSAEDVEPEGGAGDSKPEAVLWRRVDGRRGRPV